MAKETKNEKNDKKSSKVASTKRSTAAKEEKDKSKKKETVIKTSTSSKTTKKSSARKTTKKVSSSSKSTKKASSKKKVGTTVKSMLSEYYDLPYGYNETTVKILAQTPTTLFVYWDISEEDRNNLINMHGDNFFYETRPILIVHNTTKKYSFEVEINDFANSWYIRCQEPNCDYVIELGRKIIQRPDEYIYIDSSNDIVSPNDHILFENIDLGNVLFRNAKTRSSFFKRFW